LLLGALSTLLAAYDKYTIAPSDEMFHFVKIGAFTQESNAYALQQNAKIPMHIIHLGKFYSVVSDGLEDMEETKRLLAQIQTKYKDAYIISLSKLKQEVPTKSHKRIEKTIKLSTYEKGVRLYHDKHYEEALVLFDRVLIDDEEDIDALMFYAKTLYILKIKDEAKKSFKLLLTKALTRRQKEEVSRYLEAIESKEKRHFFQTTLSVGMGYDDNVNLTTDKATTLYGPLTLINDTNKTNSTFGTIAFSLTHRYKSESFDVISTLYNFNELLHSAKGNDLNYLDFSTGVRKRLGNWMLWFPLGANISYLDGVNIGHNFYTTPTISYHLNRQWTGTLQGRYIDNTSTYMRVKDYRLVGSSLGLGYTLRYVTLGARLGYQELDLKESYRYDMDKKALSSQLFGRYNISKNNFISANIAYVKEDYQYTDPVLGYAREDDIVRYGVSLGQKLGKDGLLQLGVSRIENDSNVNAYAYDKNSYTLQYHYTLKDK
jgi:hypothetical protein